MNIISGARPRARGWIAGASIGAILATGLTSTVAPAYAGADWREVIGKQAEARVAGTSMDWRAAAAAALGSPAPAPVTDAEVAGLTGAEAAYVDEIRFRSQDEGAAVLAADASLATDLQSGLNSGRITADPGAQATSDLLAADVLSVRTMLADAELLVAAESANDRDQALAQARGELAQAVDQWHRAQPVAVIAHLRQALPRIGAVLAAHGFSSYDLTTDRDGDGLPDLLELRAGSDPRVVDSDGDGLTDKFEVLKTSPWHEASSADTDGNGVGDAAEDIDHDGLTAAQEQAHGTNPLVADTDRDRLDDAAEVSRGTDPSNADSDGDALIDGAEVEAGLDPTVPDTDGDGTDDLHSISSTTVHKDGVTAVLRGTGDLAGAFDVETVSAGAAAASGTGRVGPALDFSLDASARPGLTQATVSLPYDAAQVSDPDQLRVFTFDEAQGRWIPVEGEQPVDPVAHTVTVSLPHFSIYAIFSIPAWQASFTGLGGTCTPTGTGAPVHADVAFVLDSSGSMSWNDPNDLRLQASKNFVDAFADGDKGAVVDFDYWATLLQSLTGDHDALKSAIDRIDSDGGTNIGAGVRVGLDELARDADPAVAKIMILLTDGVGAYDDTLTTRAGNERVTIYTVGLGQDIDASLLSRIAQGTGGKYYQVTNAADLPQVFRQIDRDSGDQGQDTDGDGISDCDEEQGVIDGATYERFTSDPRNPDTDGDGLPDGAELGDPHQLTGLEELLLDPAVPDTSTLRLYDVNSDPRQVDSDGDGLDDAAEADETTQARDSDSDNDGTPDAEELQVSTGPVDWDTDLDGFGDGYELAHEDDGFNPIVYNEKLSKLEYLSDFTVGATCGGLFSACEMDNIPWLLGNLTSGFLVYGDVRDAISGIIHGDVVGTLLSAAGLIPLAGDAVKVADDVVTFLRRVSKNDRLFVGALKVAMDLSLPVWAKVRVISRSIDGLDEFRAAGVADDVIVDLARHGTDMKALKRGLQLASGADAGHGVFARFQDSENALRAAFPGSLSKGKRFSTDPNNPKAVRGSRVVDAWHEATETAREAKMGFQTYDTRLASQVAKDALLRDDALVFRRVEWHFYASGRSGTIGASQELIDALVRNGIPFFIHLP